MSEAQVAAGYHGADRFHRFLEVDQDDLLVDPRFPDYAARIAVQLRLTSSEHILTD
jgi:hypothetical protein